jgi:hypothetical protein
MEGRVRSILSQNLHVPAPEQIRVQDRQPSSDLQAWDASVADALEQFDETLLIGGQGLFGRQITGCAHCVLLGSCGRHHGDCHESSLPERAETPLEVALKSRWGFVRQAGRAGNGPAGYRQ